ncbi:MAG: hypothetical protein LC772_00450 [Chloroflexi bacterium]|nr:hypothetical protein [Chloroflexota bacterium]
MKWGSIRVRLSVWNAAVLALLLGAFGVVLCLTTQDRIQGALDNEMLIRARRSAAAPPPPPWPGPRHGGDGGPFHGMRGPSPPDGMGSPPAAGGPGPDAPDHGGPDHGGPDHGGPDHGGPHDGGPAGEDGRDGMPDQFGPGQGPAPRWIGISSGGSSDGFQNLSDNPEVQRFVSFLFPRFIARTGQSAGGPGAGLRAAWDPATVSDSFRGDEVFSTVEVRGSPVRVVSVPWHRGGQVVGAVQMARDESDYSRLWAGQWRTLWTLLPLALIGAGLAGLFLTGRALRPVHEPGRSTR